MTTDFDPERSAGHVTTWAARLFCRRMDRELKPSAVSTAQLAVLLPLAELGPLLQRDLVRRCAVGQPAMVAMLGRLERAGFVQQRPHESDRRASIVKLTERGRQALEDVQPVLAAGNECAFAGFSPDERNETIDYIKRMISNLAEADKSP